MSDDHNNSFTSETPSSLIGAVDRVIARMQPQFDELNDRQRMANASGSSAATAATTGVARTNQTPTAPRTQAGVPSGTPAARGPHPASPQGIAEALGLNTSHGVPAKYLRHQEPMPWIDINPFNCRYLGPATDVHRASHAAVKGEQFCSRCGVEVRQLARQLRRDQEFRTRRASVPKQEVRCIPNLAERRGDARSSTHRSRSPDTRGRPDNGISNEERRARDYGDLVRNYHRRDHHNKPEHGGHGSDPPRPVEQVPIERTPAVTPACGKRANAIPLSHNDTLPKNDLVAVEVAAMLQQKSAVISPPTSRTRQHAQPLPAPQNATTTSGPSVPLRDPNKLIPDATWVFARKMVGAYFFDQIQHGKHELAAAQETMVYFRNQQLDPRLQRQGDDPVAKAAAYQAACFLLQAKQKAHLARLDGDGW